MSEQEENYLEEENEEGLYERYRVIADEGQTLLRIDKFLMDRVPNISRNKIQQCAKEGYLQVNKEPVKSNYKVKPLDEIVLLTPEEKKEIEITPENIPLEIIYEDDQVVVLNKQAGLVVHPGFGNFSGTLVNALAYHLNSLASLGEHERPGLVHRLDKNTSGLMVVAKTDFALNHLAKQFFNRTTKRSYNALIWGEPAEEEGTITGHIGRNSKNRKVMDVFPDGDYGKEAITDYKVLRKFHYVSLVECKLRTGRTHQIRAHFKYIGHPLFGDFDYGGDRILKGTTFTKYKQFIQNCFEILPRQALHAKSLGFEHPTTGKQLYFESDLPQDLSAVIGKWEIYTKSKKDNS